MGVYDTATKLASEIKGSKEYKIFRKNMKDVKNDKKSEELLKEYRDMQIYIQGLAIKGKELDKKMVRKLETIQKKVANNINVSNYLDSEEKFAQMMNNINKIIADSVEKDYR